MSFYRRISPLEVTYLGTDTPERSPFVNQFIIEGHINTDQPDIEQWRRAVIKAAEANPGIRLRLKGFWGFKYWDDNGPLPSVTLKDSDWSGIGDEGCAFSGTPIDVRTDPVAEVILIKDTKHSEILRIIYRTHHAACDGKATMHWIAEVFRALKGEPVLGSKGRYMDWDIIKTLEAPERTVREGNCLPVTPTAKDPQITGCHWMRFDVKGTFPRILPRLMIAIAEIARKNNDDPEGKILLRIPSDLRRYWKDQPLSIANITGAIDLEIKPDDTPKTVHKAIIGQMRKQGDLSVFPKNTFMARWLPPKLFRFRPELYVTHHEKGRYRMTGVVSYPGDLDLNDYSYPGFIATRAYGVPIPFEDRGISAGFFTWQDNVCAILSVPCALANREQLRELGEHIKQQLIESQ